MENLHLKLMNKKKSKLYISSRLALLVAVKCRTAGILPQPGCLPAFHSLAAFQHSSLPAFHGMNARYRYCWYDLSIAHTSRYQHCSSSIWLKYWPVLAMIFFLNCLLGVSLLFWYRNISPCIVSILFAPFLEYFGHQCFTVWPASTKRSGSRFHLLVGLN